jgi:hypothetical protein
MSDDGDEVYAYSDDGGSDAEYAYGSDEVRTVGVVCGVVWVEWVFVVGWEDAAVCLGLLGRMGGLVDLLWLEYAYGSKR